MAPFTIQGSSKLMDFMGLGFWVQMLSHSEKTGSFTWLHFELWMLDDVIVGQWLEENT